MTQRRIYQEEYPYFITFRTQDGFSLFEETKMARLLANEIFISAHIKRYDVLAFQIMPDHAHLLTHIINPDRMLFELDRTLESVRSEMMNDDIPSPTDRTFSKVRSDKLKNQFTISDLMQSIKGNFSRKIHMGNIWQKRFYARIVTTDEYLRTAVEYIINNPIKAALPRKYHDWPYQFIHWEKINELL